MSLYRIHRLKESARQQFRWAPHTAGLSTAKPKDYEQVSSVEAASPYAAWLAMRDGTVPLQPGDILESETGDLCIYKYIGFEQVQWLVPEAAVQGSSAGPSQVSATEPGVL